MEFVVVQREGISGDRFRYYAGYRYNSLTDCGPVFNQTITRDAVFSEPIADAVVKQLSQLGYAVEKHVLNGRTHAQTS